MSNPNFNPTYSTNDIWRDIDDTRCLTDDLDAIESDIVTLETGKADVAHTHSEYALVNHTHEGYALASDVAALSALVGDTAVSAQISNAITNKVDVVDGKELSSNDYTDVEKTKLAGIAEGANNYTLPTASSTLGGVKTTSTVTSNSGYTACPIISGVPYYKDTNTTYTLSSFGVTATATELNYVDGVTSNVQTQLNAKAASSHNHSASNITSGTLAIARGGTGASTVAGALSNFGIEDFVVSQGKSGNTYYRKWNSGILEQWYQVSTTSQAINSAYGSMYIGTHRWTFPVAFTDVDVVLCSYFRWGTSASWGGLVGATTTYADLCGYDLYSRATGTTCTIAAYAKGRWK